MTTFPQAFVYPSSRQQYDRRPARAGAPWWNHSATGAGRGWMDKERLVEAMLDPDKIRIETDPYAPLEAARRDNLDRVEAGVRAGGRVPRVCRYALSVGGHEPQHSLEKAAAFAVRQSWQVGVGQSYTDHHGPTDPLARPGWCLVRQQIRAGYADGVVVITPFVISPQPSEYQQQLDWFAAHFGFIAVVAPDAETGRR
ncbi:hypothetical protein AB0J38_01890 [Streptomyces sp. NPDC050095]|uniref:hypothetical protein n=1 Tax=unclassified Streptomyces TaxID=2593676 RepID=UPI00344AEC34